MKRPPFDTLPTPQPREEAVQATVRAATQAFRQREASRPAGISPPAGPVPPQALVAAPGGGAGPALVAAPVRRHRL